MMDRFLKQVATLLCCCAARIVAVAAEYPSHITLRAGIFHAPPFAYVDRDDISGKESYRGFEPDMLERLQIFASQDNVTLDFELSQAPPQYAAALDLVANDCENVTSNNPDADCNKFDLIVGDYYCNAERSMRVDFTPSWLRTTMSTLKYVDKTSTQDYTTLTQASQAGATVCVPDGTYLMTVVMNKFPDANYYKCPSPENCLEELKAERCVLYADDELLLRYRAAYDPSLEVTREQFNTQYLVWPMRETLPPMVSQLMKKWIYAAVANATLDKLYFQYFEKELCPLGFAGSDCTLPCDPDHGTADAKGVCVCESTRWTGADCSIEIPEDTNMIPTSLKLLSFGMLGINAVVIAACASWLYVYRDTAEVRISQPFFLLLVLLGCLISSCTIIALAQEDEGDRPVNSCMAIPWLYSVGFSVTFGSLFAKILRVYLFFTQAAHPKAKQGISNYTRRNPVTFKETLLNIGAVLLIDMAILIAWTVIDPLKWQRQVVAADQFGAPLESEGYCTSDSWKVFGSIIGGFHLFLLGLGCYLCYVSRDIPTKFSEGKYVSIAMVSNLQILVVGVPILIILGSDPQAGFFVRSVIIWMNDLAVVSLIFGNLMWSVHFSPRQRNDDSVKAEIGKAVSIYSNNPNVKTKSSAPNFNITSSPSSTPATLSSPALADATLPDLEAQNHQQTLTKKKPRRKSLISSLSAGSAESYNASSNNGSATKRSKNVSWGVVSYSETGDRDSSIMVSLAELSNESDSERDSNSKAQSGAKRFASHPIQGAPQKPASRRSVVCDDDDVPSGEWALESESDSGSETSSDASLDHEDLSVESSPCIPQEEDDLEQGRSDRCPLCRPNPTPVQGPPTIPARFLSSIESLDAEELMIPEKCPHHHIAHTHDESGRAEYDGVVPEQCPKHDTHQQESGQAEHGDEHHRGFDNSDHSSKENEQRIQGAPRKPPRRRSLSFDLATSDSSLPTSQPDHNLNTIASVSTPSIENSAMTISKPISRDQQYSLHRNDLLSMLTATNHPGDKESAHIQHDDIKFPSCSKDKHTASHASEEYNTEQDCQLKKYSSLITRKNVAASEERNSSNDLGD